MSQRQGVSFSKNLESSIPVTFPSCLSFAISSICMQLSIANVSWLRYITIVFSQQNRSFIFTASCNELSKSPHWVVDPAKCKWVRLCWNESTEEESMTFTFGIFIVPRTSTTGSSSQFWLLRCNGPYQSCADQSHSRFCMKLIHLTWNHFAYSFRQLKVYQEGVLPLEHLARLPFWSNGFFFNGDNLLESFCLFLHSTAT